jgi:hypothetical protein
LNTSGSVTCLYFDYSCVSLSISLSLYKIHVEFIGKFDRETLYRFLLPIQANLPTERKLRVSHADGFYDAIPIFDACHIIRRSFQGEISTK